MFNLNIFSSNILLPFWNTDLAVENEFHYMEQSYSKYFIMLSQSIDQQLNLVIILK